MIRPEKDRLEPLRKHVVARVGNISSADIIVTNELQDLLS